MEGNFYERLTGIFACPNIPIHIIGVGGVGSHLALLAVKYGVRKMHLWDFDEFGPHNVSNQVFFPEKHLGMNKALAVKEVCETFNPRVTLTAHPSRFTGISKSDSREAIVFICVDSMSARRSIIKSLKFSGVKTVIIETGMGVSSVRTCVFNGHNQRHFDAWLSNEYFPSNGEFRERAPCGTALTVGATCAAVASSALWLLVDVLRGATRAQTTRFEFSPVNLFTGERMGTQTGETLDWGCGPVEAV